MMKRLKLLKRAVALIVVFAMLSTLTVFGEVENNNDADTEAVLLETQAFEPLGDTGAYGFIGTKPTKLDEFGKYIVTFYRNGDTTTDVSMELKTIDVSAEYGKDYVINDDRYNTEINSDSVVIMDNAGDVEAAEAADEAFDKMEEIAEEEKDVPVQNVEKSSLATLKEEQTGMETRDTYLSATANPLEAFTPADMDFSNHIDTSTTTLIEFAAGETEKQIIFEVLDDNESEADEIFDIHIANPSEGLMLGNTNTTFTIVDNDEKVMPKLSFSQDKYESETDTVTVEVKRSEAEYYYVTATIVGYKNDGTVIFQEPIEMMEHSNSVTAELNLGEVSQGESIGIQLYDIKGADEGEITVAEILKKQMNVSIQEFDEDNDEEVELAGETKIDIPGEKNYLITGGDSNIKQIVDPDIPSRVVGEWYEPTNKANGGNFTLNQNWGTQRGGGRGRRFTKVNNNTLEMGY